MRDLRVVYDRSLFGSGYILSSKNYKTFMKFYKVGEDVDTRYCVVAQDKNVDKPNQNFRDIRININQSHGSLYFLVKSLYEETDGCLIENKDTINFGNSHFRVEKSRNGYDLIVCKDVTNGNLIKCARASVILGHQEDEHIQAISNFYNSMVYVTERDIFPEEKDLIRKLIRK